MPFICIAVAVGCVVVGELAVQSGVWSRIMIARRGWRRGIASAEPGEEGRTERGGRSRVALVSVSWIVAIPILLAFALSALEMSHMVTTLGPRLTNDEMVFTALPDLVPAG